MSESVSKRISGDEVCRQSGNYLFEEEKVRRYTVSGEYEELSSKLASKVDNEEREQRSC